MAEITSDKVRELLENFEGQTITLNKLRHELQILPGSNSFDSIRTIVNRLCEDKVLSHRGRGEYKVVKKVSPVECFKKDPPPPFDLKFPRDYETEVEVDFAEDLVIYQGDLILIAGESNFGKTQMCLSFAGENIDSGPVLMGNEYTTPDNQAGPRFLKRLRNMSWVNWQKGDGSEKFTLLPVRQDYAEHIVKDRINIIDWINLEEHYNISRVMEDIKAGLGKGVGIIAIQKAAGAEAGRGGQFTKDFADVEILLDRMPETEKDILLTLGKVKESKGALKSKNFTYGIEDGVKIINFRPIKKCGACFGKGWRYQKPCDACNKSGFVEK